MQILARLRNLFRASSTTKKWVPDPVYPDDVFIVSYPKSGNTWVRFLIGNYVTGGKCTFKNNHLITPDIHMNPERIENLDRPRFIKSHSQYEGKYPNTVYIVRDGRDVSVSYYHYSLKMGNVDKDLSFSGFLDMFNEGSVGPFGKWSDHVNGWLDHAEEDVVITRYEDLLDDAAGELKRMLEFCGITIDEDRVDKAVEASSFERMRRLREEQQDVVQTIRQSDPEKKFLRSGEKGEWKEYVAGKQKKKFLNIHKGALKRAGYIE